MKLKKIPFRQNRKLQFVAVALVAVMATLLFLFGWKMEGKNLAAELSRDFSAIEAIKTEVAAVKSARNNYFRAIGKGNGGAYDRYQDAADCPANLDWRLISLKNLRNDLRRLLGEIGLREQEQKIEIEEAKFLNDVAKMAEEVFDVEGLKAREAAARTVFEEDTINLVNCLETFGNWENCKEERVTFLETRKFYLREIAEMRTEVDLDKIEAEKRLEEMLEGYNPQTSGLINKIQPKLLKADSNESYTSTDYAVNDPAMTDAQATKILNEEAAKADAVTGGAQDTADSTSELAAGATAAGSSEESSTTISGSGTTAGLAVFKKYYEGNKYGSAIGMVTGWTNFMLPFVGAIAIAALVYAGFLYLTAAGNEEQTGKAKKIIIWVVIGIIIIFFAYAIVNTLLEGDSSGSGGGTSVDVSIGGIDFSYDD
ncbi:hypothetical protein KKF38_00390 [Patescibacteria group bacterium]|nr:hypothetical protein [Patescibacteria group bacterium]